MDNKNQAVWEWLFTCSEISDLFFNFGASANGNTIVGTTAAERVVKAFINGSSVRQYDFAIIQFKPANTQTPNNTENVTIMFDVEAVMQWVDTQAIARNFPAFPSDCQIQKIENLNNMPVVAGQDELGAKYMFTVRITYLERRG